MTLVLAKRFDHLLAMTDGRGLFEHADLTRPRLEHGYCTDDNARLLIVCSHEADAGDAGELGRIALRFTLDAQVDDGRFHNRMDLAGAWTDQPSTDDCWGRSVWALGTAATHHDDPDVADLALAAFGRAAPRRSRWPRTMAFAALGAADVLAADPTNGAARSLLRDAATTIGTPAGGAWNWPHARLSYANAALAEAVIAAGAGLGDPDLLDDGLAMLGWLLGLESASGHLSVAPVGGRDARDVGPRFDQQPIEVAAMADACWRAYTLTGGMQWVRGIELAAAWFDGANDAGTSMRDPASGGSYDGLRADGPNLNQGAESTLALVATMQRARSMQPEAA